MVLANLSGLVSLLTGDEEIEGSLAALLRLGDTLGGLETILACQGRGVEETGAGVFER